MLLGATRGAACRGKSHASHGGVVGLQVLLVICGIACGVVGFIPLLIAMRKVTPALAGHSLAPIALGSVAISFVIMIAGILAVHHFFPDQTVLFLAAPVGAFVVVALVCAIRVRRQYTR